MQAANNEGSYCTVAEAAKISDLVQSQIIRQIEDGHLPVYLNVHRQQFLVCSRSPKGAIIGHAVCEYKGAARVHKSYVEKALDGESFNLDQNMLIPVEIDRVKNWSVLSPYSIIPIGNLAAWEPLSFEGGFPKSASMMPFPSERKSMANQLADIISGLPEVACDGELAKGITGALSKSEQPLMLNYKSDHEYCLEDLRVSSVDIVRPPLEAENTPPQAEENLLPLEPPMERADELARLIWRIVRDDLGVTERDAWNQLRNDADSDNPVYDTSNILIDADNLGLSWLNADSKSREFKRSSFEVKLSRTKRRANEYLAELEGLASGDSTDD